MSAPAPINPLASELMDLLGSTPAEVERDRFKDRQAEVVTGAILAIASSSGDDMAYTADVVTRALHEFYEIVAENDSDEHARIFAGYLISDLNKLLQR